MKRFDVRQNLRHYTIPRTRRPEEVATVVNLHPTVDIVRSVS